MHSLFVLLDVPPQRLFEPLERRILRRFGKPPQRYLNKAEVCSYNGLDNRCRFRGVQVSRSTIRRLFGLTSKPQ